MMVVLKMSEDTARVLANACDAVPLSKNRDSLIAHQVSGVIQHFLLQDTIKPMRWADEPLPVVEGEE